VKKIVVGFKEIHSSGKEIGFIEIANRTGIPLTENKLGIQ
jgi:hypothetical protein